ncbi:hypothetical protein HH214_18505 [Mucilaginibacter robiniae]|uniref:Uncharacterized protein n=1 Tax=Mucilaginibacter robiniae TaxID=2728022 RepID=A0A7L5E7E1_9SPHI|nr:DUF5694 domain-containing protein [Mucilaginibacter robiniae]QJD97724.1 hypothetical protein HH214_18505 [Mucilaginibacter robiniae]
MHKKYFHKYWYVLILFWLALPGLALAQKASIKTADKRLETIFEDDKPKPRVLLLGVFHFAGEQVDANTTPANLRVDMLSAERQKQIEHLVHQLAAFKPTKIVIEDSPRRQHYYDSLYNAFKAGKLPAGKAAWPADETIQLAFRLAKLMNHETLYPADAQAFRFKLSHQDSILTFEKYKDQGDSSYTYWDKAYEAEKAYEDSLNFHLPLNEYLRYLNSPQRQAKAIGRWLVTTKRGSNTEPIGADGFVTRYFNRNVRIYSNIQRIVTSKHDRILVIYGATHMYLLKQLFEASPEFIVEDVMKYLN